ncbi:MAG: manganese-binding transcriptional regulator MntR [Planctomycetota bacterium]
MEPLRSPTKRESFQMPERPQNSEPHLRTRRDHASETAEDYVEAIDQILEVRDTCRLTDLARRFAVSHVTANRIVERLQREGYVTTEPYQPIRLTRKGKRLASECRKRHEIVFQFLLAIGIDAETAANDAEGIEHHVSPATLERFREMSNAGSS